jgi:uncharacterized protein (DUF1786 family)
MMVIVVGTGTQYILIYEPDKPLSASYKLVLPSPTVIAAKKIKNATAMKRDIWLYGSIMGGGPVTDAVSNHLKAGLKVFAQEKAALSLHDNLEKIASWGVEFNESKPTDTTPILCGDVDVKGLAHAMDHFGLSLPDKFAVAVQDHGFNPEGSNRILRFKIWEDFISSGGNMADLAYKNPPEQMTRLKAITEALPNSITADTASAALLGVLEDSEAKKAAITGLTVLNVGNGHTVAFLVKDNRVTGVYEHHTSLLDTDKLKDQLTRFKEGRLECQEVMDDWGHGCRFTVEADYSPTVITGPRRNLAEGLGRNVVVHGDMMLSGCFGLVRLAEIINSH